MGRSYPPSSQCKAYCQRRRQERVYLLRKQHVKNFWICAGFGVLLFPTLHVMVSVGLFTTFLSFMYLDEAAELET